MKKYIGLVFCVLVYGVTGVMAQVGTPTNNANKNSILDLNNTSGTNTKGLLLPKVALTATNSAAPLAAHVAGMHVYNTAMAGSGAYMVTPGEYYNDGTQWLRLAGTAWALGGNSTTSPGANSIGTTDAADFAVRTNNTERMRVTTNGNVLVGTTSVPTGGTNAKLIINNGTTAGALQIKDGTQQEGAVLVSDANGLARWQKNSDLTIVYRNTVAQTLLYNESNILQTSQPINITTKGSYIATLRWWGKTDGPNAFGVTSAYISVLKNGIKVDEIQYFYSLLNGNFNTFTVTLFAPNCVPGDVLTIGITPFDGPVSAAKNWYTGAAGVNSLFMPSIILSKL